MLLMYSEVRQKDVFLESSFCLKESLILSSQLVHVKWLNLNKHKQRVFIAFSRPIDNIKYVMKHVCGRFVISLFIIANGFTKHKRTKINLILFKTFAT